jgi:hypothetical protein
MAHTFSAKPRWGPETGQNPTPDRPIQANFRRKTRAPNVTCNVWGVGLASKLCHFEDSTVLDEPSGLADENEQNPLGP